MGVSSKQQGTCGLDRGRGLTAGGNGGVHDRVFLSCGYLTLQMIRSGSGGSMLLQMIRSGSGGSMLLQMIRSGSGGSMLLHTGGGV